MRTLFLASIAAKTLSKFVSLLPDKPVKYAVAFIPTAADPYEDKSFVTEDRDKLIELGFKVTDVDIKDKTENQLSDELRSFDIIFVAGGNTFYLLEKVRESGFDKVLIDLIQKGVIYVGSSAGAIILCSSTEPIKTLDDPTEAPNLKSYDGLNLVDFVILPHFGKEKYKPKYDKIMQKYGKKYKLITITDLQAVVVENNKYHIVEESE